MTTKNIGDGRLLRVCDLCGGVDDHPRHVVVGAGGSADAVIPAPSEETIEAFLRTVSKADRARLLRDLMDVSVSDRHMDCCREASCPDGSCDVQTAGAEDQRGADLLAHLTREA